MEETKKPARRKPRRRKAKVVPLPPKVESYVSPPIVRTRNIVLLLAGAPNVKDRGPVTGIQYTFHPGETTPVDVRDYESLLARRTSPKSCCGGKSPPVSHKIYGIA